MTMMTVDHDGTHADRSTHTTDHSSHADLSRAGQAFGIGSELDGEPPARTAMRKMVAAGLFDDLFAEIDGGGLALTGEGGFLPEMVKAVLERGLAAELTDHLGYGKGDPAGRGSGNSRNGSYPKTVTTEIGKVAIDVPRDRNGSFEPVTVPKGQRRLDGLNTNVISLYAKG